MRKLRSEVHEISTVEIWAAGTLFFSVGAMAGGLLFGVFSTGGNAADVVAAIGAIAAAVGTWVIGYGAWKYAREAHALHRNELKAQSAAQLDERFAVLNKLSHTVDCLQHALSQFGNEMQDESIAIEGSDFLGSCDAVVIYIDAQDWDEICSIARDAVGIDMLSALRLRIRDIVKQIAAYTSRYVHVTPKHLPRDDDMNSLIEEILGLRALCVQLTEYEWRRRQELNAQAKSIDASYS